MISWYMAICTLCAYFVKGVCGFANTLVFSSMLSFREDNVNISPVDLLLGYPANALMVWRERKSLEARIWLPLSVLVILGCIPGALALKNLDAGLLKVIFGGVIVLLGIEMLTRVLMRKKQHAPKWLIYVVGPVAGVMCGLFSIGALLAAYVGRTAEDAHAFRGNLSMVFFAENTFRLVLYIVTGILTLESLSTALMLAPVMLAGLFIGMRLSGKLSDKSVMCGVAALLIFSGASLVIGNL